MQWLYQEFSSHEGKSWSDDDNCKRYGDLSAHEEMIRRYCKLHFAEGDFITDDADFLILRMT